MFICENCIHNKVCAKYNATGGNVRECEHFMDSFPKSQQRHAKWEWFDAWDGNDTFGCWKMLRCSDCLESEGARENAKYCPNCGAIMDLK